MTNDNPTGKKLWDGRFSEATDAFVEQFTASVGFDQVMADQDIRGSIAHATMLCQVGVLSEVELTAIIGGLEAIQAEIHQGIFSWSVALEDVHMNIESALTDRIGSVGKKTAYRPLQKRPGCHRYQTLPARPNRHHQSPGNSPAAGYSSAGQSGNSHNLTRLDAFASRPANHLRPSLNGLVRND